MTKILRWLMIQMSKTMYKQKLIFLICICVTLFGFLFASFTRDASASSLTSASVTLSNSRLSFKATIATGSAGSSLITIVAGGGDANTNHLFPGDVLCFTDAGNNVCRDDKTYVVDSIVDATHFNLTTPLTTALTATDYAVASQSGTWTIGFTTTNTVPIGGELKITIPMANSAAGDNGIPDTTSAIATSGFDLNKIAAGNVTVSDVSGCAGADWGTVTITPGATTVDHVLTWTRSTSTCAGGKAVTVTVAGPGIVNPAPITSGHTQGTADVYGINVATTDGTNTIDYAIPRAAPVEAVLISANVDESLSLVVTGTDSGTSHCGINTSVTTTATSIPWGHLAAPNTFYLAAQNLVVNTNAASGYVVTIQENDQMGKNGNTCTGTAPSAGNYTFGAGTCIRDTSCAAGTCSESVAADWTDAINFPGLGYSIATVGATYLDAPFYYDQGGRTFSARQLADSQGSETAATIMNNSGPVSNSSIDICYRISIPGTQPSGYYYNIAKYTATATF